jgi:phosphoadenosine phosphosulfate reductase
VAKKKRTTALFDPIKASACITDRVLVGVSGGKDSAVTLELCSRFFQHVTGFFMYIVPGLSFQERILRYYELRYKIKILRIPHFMLSEFYRYGTFRVMDDSVPIVSTLETYNYVRELTDTWWIAGGERISDSIIRRAMIKRSSAIDRQRGRFYPIAYWNKQDVMDYIRLNKLRVGEESRELGFSFRSLMPQEIITIKKFYPEDYARIRRFFPLIEATIAHYEYNPDFYLDKGALLNDQTDQRTSQ